MQKQARSLGDTINKSLEHKYLFSQMSSASCQLIIFVIQRHKIYNLIHDACTVPSDPQCSCSKGILTCMTHLNTRLQKVIVQCVYVKGMGKLLIGFQGGIEGEEWAFHNSCTKAW